MGEELQQQQNNSSTYGYGSSLDIESAASNALLREQVCYFFASSDSISKLLFPGQFLDSVLCFFFSNRRLKRRRSYKVKGSVFSLD